MFLVAVLDWYSRYVLAWQLSNTLETQFVLPRSRALEAALEQATPEIFNADCIGGALLLRLARRLRSLAKRPSPRVMDPLARCKTSADAVIDQTWTAASWQDFLCCYGNQLGLNGPAEAIGEEITAVNRGQGAVGKCCPLSAP